ncbi:ABC transporter substrate-binding protein [Shewanella sp. UCD-KL12]|uniref:substrate-binding periplasmic protein n=1 Tax=Shewanella sp. UCD-KL12 TaxID=1917163 RepID=UPI000970B36A|nr:transporter substrate-binding domain-containing protein [Shewanella sp. UCD-KL12]
MLRYSLLLILLFSTIFQSHAESLKIVCHEFAPFSYEDENHNVTGILVEITRQACKSWEHSCDIELLPNKRAKQVFHSGLAEGHFLGWNAERANSIWFSVPLLETEYGFYTLKHKEVKTINQLAGKNIGVFAPSNTYQSLLDIDKRVQQSGMPAMHIYQFNSANEQPLKMLSIERFDAYFVNRDVGAFYAHQLGLNGLDYLGSEDKIHYFLGFKMRYNNYDIIKSFNHHLDTLLRQGEFDTLYKQWKMQPPSLPQSEYSPLNIPF